MSDRQNLESSEWHIALIRAFLAAFRTFPVKLDMKETSKDRKHSKKLAKVTSMLSEISIVINNQTLK